MENHLDLHYTVKSHTGVCLRYQPGNLTRLPNRYYTFRYGGIDFFALDSNTFNTPEPLPENQAGDIYRRELLHRRQKLEQEELQILAECEKLNSENPAESE